MCIAIVKPAGKWVSKDALYHSFLANPNGAGYAFLKDGEVIIKKGFFSFKDFFKAYSKDVTADVPAMAHFRIATRGPKDEANCHPFAIDNGALMHNGPCLNYKHCNGDKDRSDSRQFAEDMVKTLSFDTIKAILPIISGFAGSEKIAFMFTNGEFLIANETEGLWSEGCWYSNSSFRGYFSETGSAYRGANWGTGSGYRPTGYGTSSAGSTTGGTTRPSLTPKNLDAVIKRSFGVASPLFDCKWSLKLDAYVPQDILIENTRMCWNELYSAYIPADVRNKLCTDKRYVYEATDEAEERSAGPRMSVDADWVIVGDVLQNEHDLRVFILDAQQWVEPAPPAADPPPSLEPNLALTVEKQPETTAPAVVVPPVVDASTAQTGETVH